MEYKLVIVLLSTAHCLIFGVSSQSLNAIVEKVIEEGRKYMEADDTSDKDTFDYIVVGAGTAGSVMADRLSEDGKRTVLLLEAGKDETAVMSIPALANYQRGAADWGYTQEPMPAGCPLGPEGRCAYPRGKGMGGSTLINAMIYARGNRKDYDEWAALGNAGWGYDDVLDYFRKSENVQIPQLRGSQFHGTKGPLPVSYSPFSTRITDLVLEAAAQKNISQVDYNGASQAGVSPIQATMKDGQRWSANRAFLLNAKSRPNLFVRKRSLVTCVLFSFFSFFKKRARGVRYERDNATYEVKARKEVILCAGAINTPQLLMLSGVGPRNHLQELGIDVYHDLPVGQNLMDHTMFLGIPLVFNESLAPTATEVYFNPANYINYVMNGKGPLTGTNTAEMLYYFQAGQPKFPSESNMEMYIVQFPPIINYQNTNVNIFQNLTGKHSVVPFLVPLYPVSKGNVSLASTDIHVQPNIFPNYFGEESDVRNAVEGIKKMLELFQTEAFQKVGATLFDEKLPTCESYTFNTDEYWECAVKRFSLSQFHPCCTCRMGNDSSAVVDHELKVKGVAGLRVVDASVLPTMISGHLQAPTYMIAEKAADIIKKAYRFW